MTNEPRPPDPPEAAKPAVQFSLRSAFVVMTLAAVGCALVFQIPDAVSIPITLLVTVALVPVLVTVIIYGSSYQRAFSIGAVFPPAMFLVSLCLTGGIFGPLSSLLGDYQRYRSESQSHFREMIGVLWASTPLMGFLCMATRRLVERRPAKNTSRAGKPSAGSRNTEA